MVLICCCCYRCKVGELYCCYGDIVAELVGWWVGEFVSCVVALLRCCVVALLRYCVAVLLHLFEKSKRGR